MISVDLETSCQKKAEFRSWRTGFQIDSIAATWREGAHLRSWFSTQPAQIDAFIRRLAELQKPLLVHNLAFEMSVFMKLYPNLSFNWAADTMRLAQLHDNQGGLHWSDMTLKTADDYLDAFLAAEGLDGASETSKKAKVGAKTTGFSLEACARRYLPVTAHNHKAEAHEWLEKNHGIKSNHGSHLHLLPYEILKRYNIADTEITLLLYENLTEQLTMLGFDWAPDWTLYTTRCRLMQAAYLRGLKIDRESLRSEIYKTDAEIKAITAEFFEKTQETRAEWARRNPGKVKKRPMVPELFNIGSNAQLKALFVGVLGIVGGRTTKTGQKYIEHKDPAKRITKEVAAREYPSFQSKHLHLYGELGMILHRRRKKLLVLHQMLGTYLASEEDGRLHAEIRCAGTATNRVAAGASV